MHIARLSKLNKVASLDLLSKVDDDGLDGIRSLGSLSLLLELSDLLGLELLKDDIKLSELTLDDRGGWSRSGGHEVVVGSDKGGDGLLVLLDVLLGGLTSLLGSLAGSLSESTASEEKAKTEDKEINEEKRSEGRGGVRNSERVDRVSDLFRPASVSGNAPCRQQPASDPQRP